MRVLGMITVTVMVAVATAAVVMGIRAIPDVRRYLKIRQM